MRHNSRPALSAATAVAVCAFAAAAAPPRYAFQPIDVPSVPTGYQGAPARIMAFDAAGNGYGYSLLMNADGPVIAAIRWEQGRIAPLDTPAGATTSHAAAISPSGDIVGWYGGDADQGGTMWRNGVPRPLGEFLPTGINSAGDVAGVVRSPVDGRRYAPALWRHGRLQVLPMSQPSAHAWVVGLSDSGAVAGSWTDGRGSGRAVLWSGGQAFELPLPEGADRSEARAINRAGWVVGVAYRADSATHAAVLWRDGEAIDLGVLDPATPVAWAQSINNANQIVGVAQTSDGPTVFLWQDGVMHDLRDLIEGGDIGRLSATNLVIGDGGHIAGVQFLEDGTTRGFVLTPVPAPGGLAALAGCALLLRRRR